MLYAANEVFQLGQAYALMGRKEDAIREGQRAVDILPISLDTFNGPIQVLSLATIYRIVGEYDDAVTELERFASAPSRIDFLPFALDPMWDPLREDPRFQRLVEGPPLWER